MNRTGTVPARIECMYRESLARIQSQAHAIDRDSGLGALPPGATATEIDGLAEALGQPLPADLGPFLIAMNGEPVGQRRCLNCRFLSTGEIARVRRDVNRNLAGYDGCGPLAASNRERNPYLDESVSYGSHWVPIATFLDYGYVFIDPEPRHARRPILFYWEFSGPTLTPVFATSCAQLLGAIEAKLAEPGLPWIPSVTELPAVVV